MIALAFAGRPPRRLGGRPRRLGGCPPPSLSSASAAASTCVQLTLWNRASAAAHTHGFRAPRSLRVGRMPAVAHLAGLRGRRRTRYVLMIRLCQHRRSSRRCNAGRATARIPMADMSKTYACLPMTGAALVGIGTSHCASALPVSSLKLHAATQATVGSDASGCTTRAACGNG